MKKNLTTNLSWTTLGMIVYNLAIWVLGTLILRVLGSTASGYYAIGMSIGNTLYAIALWGMRAYVVADQAHQFSYDEYFTARLGGIVFSFVLLGLLILIFGYSREQNLVILFYTVFKLSEAMIELMDCFGQQKFNMDINAKSMVLRGTLFMVLFYVALKMTSSLNIGFIVLILVSLTIFITFNLPRIKKMVALTPKLVFNKNLWTIWKACFPIMVFELLAAAMVAIPRLFYERSGSLEELGIYTTIYSLVIFLQLMVNIFIYTFSPYMASAYQENNMKQFKKYLVLLFGGAIGLGLLAEALVLLVGQPVITLVFGAVARDAYRYLYLGIIGGVTLTFTWIFSQIFVILKRNQAQLICSLVATIACIVLSCTILTSDCNSMTVVLILSNLVFILVAVILLWKNYKNLRKGTL